MALLKVTFRIVTLSRELLRDYLGITNFHFFLKLSSPRFCVGVKRSQRPCYTQYIGLEISIISCFISDIATEGAVAGMQLPRAYPIDKFGAIQFRMCVDSVDTATTSRLQCHTIYFVADG